MPIHSTGSSIFICPINSKVSLFLNQLLVPTITKNLISVSKFALDNGVYFEFDPNYCLVKSQGSNEILLNGSLGPDGLYVFPNLHLQGSIPASSASCFVSNSVTYVCSDVNTLNSAVKTTFVDSACTSTGSQTLWHLRLGHPSSNVLRLVLNHCKIPISNKNVFEFCTACCVGKSHRLPASLSETVYNQPLELIHSDLWSPAYIPSKNGFYYYMDLFA